MRPATASAIAGKGARGREHAVELAAAVVGHDDAVRAARGRFARVVGIENALDDQRALPLLAHPFDVLPGDARVEIGADPAHQVGERRARAEQRSRDCPWSAAGRGPRRPTPSRAAAALEQAGCRAAHRSRQPGAIIAVARARHGEIDGEQQRAAARLLGPRDHVADEAAVLDDVELEPEGDRCPSPPRRSSRRSRWKARTARPPRPPPAPPGTSPRRA